jgi:succinoglycan biosynthesis transport protein ExoP
MEFVYLFRALVRRKWIILICVAASLAAAIFFTRNLKKDYKSAAQLSTRFTVSDNPTGGVNYVQSEFEFNNVLENITSANVVSMVSYHLLLHDLRSPSPFTLLNPKQQVDVQSIDKQAVELLLSAHLDSISMLSPAVKEDKAILDLLNMYGYNYESVAGQLKVDRFQKSDYINIEYKCENPILSAFVVNTLCDEFRRFYSQNERQHSDVSISLLDSVMKAKKVILDQKQAAKEQFMANNKVLDVNMEGSSKLGQISVFESQLIEENSILSNESYRARQLDELIRNARSKGLKSVSAPGVGAKPGKPVAGNDNTEYIRLRKQYNDLYTEYTEKGSDDADMKKRLDNISQAMAKLNVESDDGTGSPSGGGSGQAMVSVDELTQKKIDADAQVEASKQKISSLEAKLAQLRSGLTGMASSGANLQKFDKEIQLASEDYIAAKDQMNVVSNLSQNQPDFKQTLIGEPALRPEPSKKLLIILLAGLGAFFVSGLVIVFMEFFDQSIRTPSQFQKLTGLRLLGIVNRIKLQGQENVLEKIAGFDELEQHRDSSFLELLRKLRYEIEASGKKIFLFTSTEPQQGKTMLVQALSYILSLGKSKVLIIDTNFCNNDLTKNINASPVLEKFDLNGAPFDKKEVLMLLTPTSVARVDIIGCQGGDYTPSEILPKNHLLNYLGQLKDEYDFIFLEGAPLNGFTDTKELANYVEGIIAVFSAEAVLTPMDKESIKFLDENRSKFLGAILNKVDADNLEM